MVVQFGDEGLGAPGREFGRARLMRSGATPATNGGSGVTLSCSSVVAEPTSPAQACRRVASGLESDAPGQPVGIAAKGTETRT